MYQLLLRFLGRLFRWRLFFGCRFFGRFPGFYFLFLPLGPLFRFLFRFSGLTSLNLRLVGQHDANVTGPLQNPARAATSTRHDPLERGAFTYHGLFYD